MDLDILINILLIIVIIVALFFISCYNSLVHKQAKTDECASNIQISLKERFDLVPNLVETVKGYTKHESGTLEDVTKARQGYKEDDFNIKNIENSEHSINRLIAVAESYPDLKASAQYQSLSSKLQQLEDRINIARHRYNRVTADYNIKVQKFPSSIVAKIFNFQKKDLFKLTSDKEQENVTVKL